MASHDDLFNQPAQGDSSGDAPVQQRAQDSGSSAQEPRSRGPESEEAAAERKPARKRASRRTPAAPAAEPPAGAGTAPEEQNNRETGVAPPADADDGASADDSTGKRAKKSAAKRTGKKAAEKAVKKAVKKASATLDAPPANSVDEPVSTGATVPSFGVLFQAPEPTAPPRRRATSATGAPAAAATPEADTSAAAGRRGAEDGSVEEREDSEQEAGRRRSRRRGGRGRKARSGEGDGEPDSTEPTVGGEQAELTAEATDTADVAESTADGGPDEGDDVGSRRRRRRRRSGGSTGEEDPPGTVTKVREPRKDREEPAGVKGSTRLEAKKQRRREGREAGRRRTVITEAEFLARRESVERVMVVRLRDGRTQIGVLEDGVLVEHYVSRETNASMAGNVYLGRVQNVLPSMEAAFVDIGKGRNAVLYAGEVNWDAAGLEINQPKRIENALKSGDSVLVQVTKDPMGHKGARLTSQVSLPGRYLVYVPEGSMTGISRKLPDTERVRLKSILKDVVPDSAGVIVRTAAEGASEDELRADVERLTRAWQRIKDKAEAKSGKKGSAGGAPVLVHGEADLTVRVIRDVFNEDFTSLVVAGETAWEEISDYVDDVAPDLGKKLQKWTSEEDVFAHYRVDEQLAKAMDRKVWLPSGGSLVIDRTEAMTVIDVNTGKFVGSGGNLEETVTKNNLEAAEEIVRQLRLRDIGGIIVIDFIDMVLESNRDLVVRRLLECLGRDRTKHQVAEVTSLGLVQMTRKRVGSGLIEVFSEVCEHCNGRGIIVHSEPVDRPNGDAGDGGNGAAASRTRGRRAKGAPAEVEVAVKPTGPTPAQIAAAAHAAAIKGTSGESPIDDAVVASALAEPTTAWATEPDAELIVESAAEQEPNSAAESAGELAPRSGTPAVAQPETPEPPSGLAFEPTPDEPVMPVAEPPAPRRRRRCRVVAPAGPPRPLEGASPTQEPSADAPASEARHDA